MTVEELEAKVKILENKIRTLEDIEEIKKLQRAYGYYLEHWMAEDIIDLFADDPDSTLLIALGEYRGKDAIRRFFRRGNEGIETTKAENPEFLHQVMQLSGIVHVDPEGKTAKGRWYGFGANAFPVEGEGVKPGWMNGVYEVDYIKENDKWKLKKVHWCITFNAPYTVGWVEPSRQTDKSIDRSHQMNNVLRPTGPPEQTKYPSGFICPFHYVNPVSGRKTI